VHELLLEAMAKIAGENNIEYDPADEKLSYQELSMMYMPVVSHEMMSGRLSETGSSYSTLIKRYGRGATSRRHQTVVLCADRRTIFPILPRRRPLLPF
jgi:hypothetical protein